MGRIGKVRKRDGRVVDFDGGKIADAIYKAARAVGGEDRAIADELSEVVTLFLSKHYSGETPGIEDIQDMVEKVLIETGHAKTAKGYILYRQKRGELRDRTRVWKRVEKERDSTDINLLVEGQAMEETYEWDRRRIVEALVREAQVSVDVAEEVAKAVEQSVLDSGLDRISTPLVRELVDNELFKRGLQAKLERQAVVGMPNYELERLIYSKSNENSNIAVNNPEAINLAIAEHTLKQWALVKLFTRDVADAHRSGAIHLHDLGYPVRVYCSSHSIEYLKKYGMHLGNLETSSAPAKHARTLTGHLNTFLASMQAYYAGALGVAHINIMFAPYTEGMSARQIRQETQHLIFSSSQNAFSRGGQTLFLDFNVHTGIPGHLRDVEAIGPGGKPVLVEGDKDEFVKSQIEKRVADLRKLPDEEKEKAAYDAIFDERNYVTQLEDGGWARTYGSFEEEAARFTRAMLEVWRDGDQDGTLFAFPKCDFHVSAETFTSRREEELLELACEVASGNGVPYFIFDRDAVVLSACCRLRTKVEDKYLLKHPESLRFCGFQNVTINLPQCAYRAGKGNVAALVAEIEKSMDVAMKAHLQKKSFIKMLMSSREMPLWEVGKTALDGRPYIDLDKATYIIGLIGLNECVQHIFGEELHESKTVLMESLKIIAQMNMKAKELGVKYGLKVTLEESPAESAARRLAKVDFKRFPESRPLMRGDVESGDIYYTNSVHLRPDAPVDLVTRIEMQSKFHSLIESGAIIHAFVGERSPSAGAIKSLVKKTWQKTQAAQLTISPEFTICGSCRKMTSGLKSHCPHCGKSDIEARTVSEVDVGPGDRAWERFERLLVKAGEA
jgi:ribonucleoside-triphosphate reductase